jgi:hypothetical protein
LVNVGVTGFGRRALSGGLQEKTFDASATVSGDFNGWRLK